MKKIFKLFAFIVLAFFINVGLINAECSVSQSELDAIEIGYYRNGGEEDELNISIVKIPDNVKIVLMDSNGNVITTSDETTLIKDGNPEYKNTFSYSDYDFSKGIDVKYEAYSLCSDKQVKTGKLKTKKYNEYSELEECRGKNSSKYCDLFEDTSKVSDEKILQSISEGVGKEPVKKSVTTNKVVDYVNLNYLYFVLPLLFGLVIVVIILLVLKNRGHKYNEKD